MKNLLKTLAGLFCVLLMSFGFSSCQQEDTSIEKSVIMINVVAPVKTTYGIGEQLDKTGMVVTAIWNDGTSEVVNDYSITGFDSSKVVNAQDVIVNYKGKMATFRVRIMEIKPVSLVISKKPLKKIYTIGSTFDKTGMEVICNYNDDSKKIITDYTLSGFNSAIEQEDQVITVAYQNLTATFTVTITSAILSSLQIVTPPSKTTYLLGEEFDTTGLTVNAVYSDGLTQEITDYIVTGFDSSSEGVKTVAIIYNEAGLIFTASYECYVGEAKELLVESENSTYYVESGFSPADINCYLVYKDNSKRKITQFSVDDFDTSVVGTQTKTVKYYDKDFYKTYEADYQYRVLNLFDYCASIMKKIMNSNITVTGSANSGVFVKGRTVTLSPFEICKFEITQDIYEKIMGTNPSQFNNPVNAECQSMRPVEYVSWYDAIAFCNKLTLLSGGTTEDLVYSVEGITDWANLSASSIPTSTNGKWDNATIDLTKKGYRLPTEAEWEFAARGGDPSDSAWNYRYLGSNTMDTLDSVSWYCGNSGYATHQVGLKLPNKLGLYDMSGNVYEWCNDWLGTRESGNVDNPIGPSSGTIRCLRGGDYNSGDVSCQVGWVNSRYPYDRSSNIGFRIARTLSE